MYETLDKKGISYNRVANGVTYDYTCILCLYFGLVLHDFSKETALDSVQVMSSFYGRMEETTSNLRHNMWHIFDLKIT